MAEQKGFGYVSPEKQRKNAARILTVEIILLLIAAFVIVITLNYLGIVPLYRFAPRIFGWLPVREGVQKGVALNPDEPIYTGENNPRSVEAEKQLEQINKDRQATVGAVEVSVISDISGYELTLLNKNRLIDLLKEWNVYGKMHDGKTPISNIIFHLVSVEQQGNKITSEGLGTYMSSSNKISGNTMDVYIHISDKILMDNTKTTSDYFQSQALRSMYRFGFPVFSASKLGEQEADLNAALKEFHPSKVRFFELEKL